MRCRPVVLLALINFCVISKALTAAEPTLIGRASCATATCHGGVVGLGPAWHSSHGVFESRDPHAHAGLILLNELSRKIAERLDPATAASDSLRNKLLEKRCAGCHAPLAIRSPVLQASQASQASSDATASAGFARRIADGVSCEACHGAASNWLVAHTRSDWSGPDRYSPQTGMLDTESVLVRTESCANCHVGSRSQDAPVRDMNHDMIAAGHPALQFNAAVSLANLPAHWEPRSRHVQAATSAQQAAYETAARLQTLAVAARLSQERLQDAGNPAEAGSTLEVVVPELSDFDCVSCHHPLQVEKAPRQSKLASEPLWNLWILSQLDVHGFDQERVSRLTPSSANLGAELKALENAARAQAALELNRSAVDAERAQELVSPALP